MPKTNDVRVILAVVGIVAGFATGVLAGRVAAQLVEEDITRIAADTKVSASRPWLPLEPTSPPSDAPTRYKVPVTRSQPSIGPSDALVTIIEWCDLYGQACRESDALVSAVLAQHPLEVRRVFRHFAGADRSDEQAHELARVAHEAGKFWAFRERLLKRDAAPSLTELSVEARAVGLDWHDASRALQRFEHTGYIAAERTLAHALGVERTPVLFVNGRMIQGAVSASTLAEVIAQELERTRSLVRNGAPRGDVYAEIIKPGVWRTRDGGSR